MLNFIENWVVQKKVSSVEVSHTIWTKPNDEETWIQQLRKPCFGHAPCRCSRPFSSIFQRYLPTEIDTWTEKRYKFSDFFFDTCIKFLCGGYFRKICWTVDKCLNWASFFFISSQYSMMNYRFDWSIDSFKLNEIGIFTRLLMHFMLWAY